MQYKSLFIDFSFPVDEVGGDIDHIKNAINALIPSGEKEAFVLDRFEIDRIVNSINSAGN